MALYGHHTESVTYEDLEKVEKRATRLLPERGAGVIKLGFRAERQIGRSLYDHMLRPPGVTPQIIHGF